MIEHRGWFRCATVGVAALIGSHGGLLAGVAFPVADIMDRIFGHLDAGRRERARKLCSRAEAALEAHACRLDPGTAESARLATERLLSSYGLTDDQFAELSLDANAAAETVLSQGQFTPDERIEILPLCRDLLHCFYKSLPEDPELLAELLPHIYRCTLSRLAHLQFSVEQVKRLVKEPVDRVGHPVITPSQELNLSAGELQLLLYMYINETYVFIHSDSDEYRCVRTGSLGQYWGFEYRPEAGDYESDHVGLWHFVRKNNPPAARENRLRWLAVFDELIAKGLLAQDNEHRSRWCLSDIGKRFGAKKVEWLRENHPDVVPQPRLDAIMFGLSG